MTEKERLVEFYKFLQGKVPNNIVIKHPPKLSGRMAFSIIWFLQERTGVFSDTIERCQSCGDLFDSAIEGKIKDTTRPSFKCDNCM
jgi:hypothetical protein